MHFKSACGACAGKGFSAPLGQVPTAVAMQPVLVIAAAPVATMAAQSLPAFLESVRLAEFAGPLAGLGASSVADLKDMMPEDFESIGMKKLHMNRLLAALQVA